MSDKGISMKQRGVVLLSAIGLSAALFAASALPTFGQTMMGGSGSSSGSTDSMTSANTMKADPMVGRELRNAQSTGNKVLFTDLAAAEQLARTGPAVLFFAADWCPYCQADLKDINAHGDRLGPVSIVVVDYDRSSDLKKMFGVTVQDTFVQIDENGNKLGIWNGGGVTRILQRVSRG